MKAGHINLGFIPHEEESEEKPRDVEKNVKLQRNLGLFSGISIIIGLSVMSGLESLYIALQRDHHWVGYLGDAGVHHEVQ